jgi:exonuclease SbcD
MKFIHIADLHIGKIVHAFSMLEDQEYALSQILEYVKLHNPDAVLIAGDIYDRSIPQPDAVRLFDGFLTSLAALGPAVAIVSGNHDSPERLGFASGILRENNVYLYGVFDGTMREINLCDEYGEARVHLLPYIRPSDVRRFASGAAGEHDNIEETADNYKHAANRKIESYQDAVSYVIESARIDKSIRNILVAHQFFAMEGANPERSESEREAIGGTDRIDAAECGAASTFDYVALGHLHGPQRAGVDHIRYAGSLLKYSFSECYHKKSAALVEIRGKGDITVIQLPLKPLRDMRRIEGPLAALTGGEALSGGDCGDYLHVTLTDEEEIFDARGKLRLVYPNLMQLSFNNARSNAQIDISDDNRIRQTTPIAQFDDFFRLQNGAALSEAQRKTVAGFLMSVEESDKGGEGTI